MCSLTLSGQRSAIVANALGISVQARVLGSHKKLANLKSQVKLTMLTPHPSDSSDDLRFDEKRATFAGEKRPLSKYLKKHQMNIYNKR